MKKNKVELALKKSSDVDLQTFNSEASMINPEEAQSDPDKLITQLRKQLALAEKYLKEQQEQHELEISNVLQKNNAEKDKLERKLGKF